MRYIVQILKDLTDTTDSYGGLGSAVIQPRQHYSIESAIQEATHLVRKNQKQVGIFKLVKTVSPPEVIIEDVKEEN